MVVISRAAATLALPTFYQPLHNQRIFTNISWGTPAQQAIPAVIDTASYGFWVYGPNATVNSGSKYLGVQGPCNQTAKPFFDWEKSTSHSSFHENHTVFAYKGASNLVNCPSVVNDTMNFGEGYPAIDNIQVAVCNYTQIRGPSSTCEGLYYEKSIMGLAPIDSIAGGPEIHPQLLRQGRVRSSVFSTWFEAPPTDVHAPQNGTLLWGAVPKEKYAGTLVTLRNTAQDHDKKGYYYVGAPELRVTPIDGRADENTSIPAADPAKVPDCLLASAIGGITLPASEDQFFKVTGLHRESPYLNPRYPAACADIPLDAGFDLVFKGQDGKSKATVNIPYRILAVDAGSASNTCRLNLVLGDSTCTLGSGFYASAFIAHDDEAKTLQIARGAVADSADGPTVRI